MFSVYFSGMPFLRYNISGGLTYLLGILKHQGKMGFYALHELYFQTNVFTVELQWLEPRSLVYHG